MRVLIAEDDRALGLFLQKGLETEGHEVALVRDGDAALEHVREQHPDLLVLDLSLPRRDGIEVLEAISGLLEETAVLVLTGRGEVAERVKCLNLGADFLMKPFALSELTARCRALLRRREQFASPVLRHGSLELNRLERTVVRGGVSVELTGKEFALLEVLLQRRGQVCTRAELMSQVWQMTMDGGTNVVDVYINYLRKKLAAALPDGGVPDAVIGTVRGEGYVIAAPPAGRLLPGKLGLRPAVLHG